VLDRLLAVGPGDPLFVDSAHTRQARLGQRSTALCSTAWRGYAHAPACTSRDDVSIRLLARRPDQRAILRVRMRSSLPLAVESARFALRTPMSMMRYERAAELEVLLKHYVPQGDGEGPRLSPKGHFHSSLYLEVVT
jgi:hypothetical protein